MPDPTAHADDMKSPAKNETMPSLWWLEPFGFAVSQWNKRAEFYAKWKTADEKRYNASTALCHIEKRLKDNDKAIMDTANEAGFQASRACYVTAGQPHSPFPLTWLGEAVAYWKGEAYAARKQRDEAKELVDYHRNNLNTFQSKVELTLRAVLGKDDYENTIELVGFAADEIKALREEQKGLLHEARVAIADNQVNEGNVDNLEARLEGKQAFINQALKDLEICQDHIAELEGKKKPKVNVEKLKADLADAKQGIKNLRLDAKTTRKCLLMEQRENMRLFERLRKLPAKPAKKKVNLKKASVEQVSKLMDIKTSADNFIYGNHEPRIHSMDAPDLDAFRFGHMHVHKKPKAKRKPAKKKAKYGDGRDDYSAIGRRYLKHLALVQARRKAIAKAKKKGGRRG